MWKAQVPYLSRHLRVITFDGRGNGRSDRPLHAAEYDDREFAADALAILDAVGVERAMMVSASAGSYWHLILAAEHPGASRARSSLRRLCRSPRVTRVAI